MKSIYVALLTVLMLSCNSNNKKAEAKRESQESKIEVIRFPQLEKELHPTGNTIHIINFFASWCIPCIEELPFFEEINAQYKTKDVNVLLVSLDFKEDLETKLRPILTKKKIASTVKLLDETDYNSWIPHVDADWDGAIPYTLIIHNDDIKRFYGSITADTLKKYIDQNI